MQEYTVEDLCNDKSINYPSNIEVKYDYINIDESYISSLIITGIPSKIGFMQMAKDLDIDYEAQFTFNIKKLDNVSEIKRITKIIADCKSERNTINRNQRDIDIINDIEQKAIALRRRIQIENEQLYNQAIYIKVFDNSKENLFVKMRSIQDSMFSRGYILRPANFRQKEVYRASLPICSINKYIHELTAKLTTSTMLAYSFMFFTNSINMKSGTFLGVFNNSMCIYDIFDRRNNNYNMCILGSSGVGKSYFIKLYMIRNIYSNITQIIIDPEGEYVSIVRSLGGCVFDENNYNMLYINEEYAINNDGNIIDFKIESIIRLLTTLYGENVQDDMRNYLQETINKVYFEAKISNNKESLYIKEDNDKIYLNKRYLNYNSFPTSYDVISEINNSKASKAKKQQAIEIITRSGIVNEKKRDKNINHESITNHKLICFNLKGVKENDISLYVYKYLSFAEEKLSKKMLVYIDEFWRCVKLEKKMMLSNKIVDMFKTLRKRNAGIVTITQDIGDFFNYENANMGKIILNNCYSKFFFKMEYTDMQFFKKVGIYEENIIKKISGLKKGSALLDIGGISGYLDIKSSKLEHRLIENGGTYNEKNSGGIR